MAPPRRKSCFACVKAKRRCDLAFPRCQRCGARDIECDYAVAPAELKSSNPSSGTHSSSVSQASDAFHAGTLNSLDLDVAGAGMDVLLGSTSTNLNFSHGSADQVDWMELMTNIDDFVVPDDLTRSSTVISGNIYQARVVFVVKQLKSYVKMFFDSCSTPFIHHRPFKAEDAPIVLQDAFAACAMYIGKSDSNEAAIFRNIRRSVRQLLDSPRLSPMDYLSSAQAMILYQIIRLFDGDIRLRAEAEADEHFLTTWTNAIIERSQPLRPAEFESKSPEAIPWDHWVFAESMRRTAVTSLLLKGTYDFLKLGWDDVHDGITKLTFYAQRDLWQAVNEMQWRDAWQKRNRVSVMIANWEVDIATARPSDIDGLGVMMMALIRGMDNTTEWLGQENLRQYGLEWGSK